MNNRSKKYFTSKYFFVSVFGFPLLGLIFIVGSIIIFNDSKPVRWYDWLFFFPSFILGTYLLILFLRLIFYEPLVGRYSISDEGITFYTLIKQIHYPWDEFIEVGVARTVVELSRFLYCIYFSKKHFSFENKKWIISKRSFKEPKKKDMPVYVKEYVCIQYSRKQMIILLESLPNWMKERLIEEEKKIILKGSEKLINI